MTESTFTMLMHSLPAVIVAIATLITSLRNGNKIKHLKIQVNSRMDQWIKSVRELALAEGHAAGVESMRNKEVK